MRCILASTALLVSATSIFAQSNIVEILDINPITVCFSKTITIVPSEKIDPLMIVKPSEKIDSGMLVEILCPGESFSNKKEETFFPPTVQNTSEKP